ncbi:MAG: FAD-dependent oxidoreductase [Ktedonobacterales bacterium]|nr:FAD-dependent oxidoreductase [Ktedonobacterales bacterium]
MVTDQETIIVGGGAASMHCALHLQEAGGHYLLITDRMGGRIMYRQDLKMNFGAQSFYANYKHMKQILTPEPQYLPSVSQVCFHPDAQTQYTALSPRVLRHLWQLLKFQNYMRKRFIPHYAQFMGDCEVMQVKDAMEQNPFIKDLFFMAADQFIVREGIQQIADDLVSQIAHGSTGSSIKKLSALDYLNCAQALFLNPKGFTFDEDAMTGRLRAGGNTVEFATVTAVQQNKGGGYRVSTSSGASYVAKNVVLATPADITAKIVESVVQIASVRDAAELNTYLIRGSMKARYRKHIAHIFGETIPLIFTAKRKEGEYEVITEHEIDLGDYFDVYEVVEWVRWPKAIFTNPNIVLDQDLAENLYMAGDHNGLGMESAAVSGIYAANRILGKA